MFGDKTFTFRISDLLVLVLIVAVAVLAVMVFQDKPLRDKPANEPGACQCSCHRLPTVRPYHPGDTGKSIQALPKGTSDGRPAFKAPSALQNAPALSRAMRVAGIQSQGRSSRAGAGDYHPDRPAISDANSVRAR